MNNPWDLFTSIYGTVKSNADINFNNADNILIAWPVILDFINKFGEKDTSLLEYGCGTGSFAFKLSNLGYKITGIDTSDEMIKTAKAAFGEHITFLNGDTSILSGQNKFTIITSIMTFQFIEDIEKAFEDLSKVLKPGGVFAFAVFNPAFIKESLRTNSYFEEFDFFEKPKRGMLKLNGNKIPVFIRTAQEYNSLLKKINFHGLTPRGISRVQA
jgi:ubiquinone/menaquinone biosynthesis C-methylase UbiE